MKQLIDINDLLTFLDRKLFRLNQCLVNFREAGISAEDCTEVENEISMWKKKKTELITLQEKILDTQVKELAQ